MRKLALILLLVLFAAPCARAQSLPLAAEIDAHAQFKRFGSYAMDDATGEWSAHGLSAQQMLSTVGQGDASGYMEGGVCVLYPTVRGNRDLSLMEPVLYVCLLRSGAIKADALSITTGGVRYDFVGKAEETDIDDRKCEQFTLPLSEEGLNLLRSFAMEGGEVRIYGESRVFRTSIQESDTYKNSKLRVEAMSVASVRDFLTLWRNDYGLWNLNAAHWAKDRPKMTASMLEADEYGRELPALERSTQILDTQKGSAVRAYQRILKDSGFFTAKLASNYGKGTRASTKQAQQYYGLLPTGMADRTLIELLKGAEQPVSKPISSAPFLQLTDTVERAIPRATYALDGQLSIRLDRAWVARCLSPSHASDILDRLWPANRSNRLYIADGELVNLSDRTLQVPSLLQGYVKINAVRYPLTLQCEQDEGQALGSSVLPMGTSRLIIFSEIPQGIETASCVLHITIQGASQKMELEFAP